MKYTIFPGCLIQNRFPEYEKSAHYILKKLDVPIEFVNSFSCCGSQIAESVDDSILNIITARNLAIAKEQKIDMIITLCGSCTYILKKAKLELDDKGAREIVNEALKKIDLFYENGIKIKHFAEILNEKGYFEKLKSKLIKSINLKVVFQNPCMLMRPDRIAQIENEKYNLIKNLLESSGAMVQNYDYQDKCCEGTMLVGKNKLGESLVKIRYDSLNETNADLMITSCPNCQLVYNIFPSTLNKKTIPSIFFTQLIGFALGGSYKELGLNRNIDFKRIKEILN
ncbi:MAG: hypothetical protein EAX96_00180 [Candidatus Lokiarchaeota archaeon]|nr:hypothetical protein [Candidatus Lokiarchaeota archaeon]